MRTKVFLPGLALLVSLMAISCSDSGSLQNDGITGPIGSGISGSSLAGVYVSDGIEVSINENGAESVETPVPWDGVSEMKSGVIYYLTPEQADVLASQNPRMFKGREEWKAGR